VPEVPGQTATPVPGGLTPEEMKELDTLAQSFGDSEDEEIAGLNKQYGDVKNAMNSSSSKAAVQTASAPAQTAGGTPVTDW
jgi:arginase family enzyme